ncbi:hypothetical protein WJX79_010660 [Trebouxia sp. C0005]
MSLNKETVRMQGMPPDENFTLWEWEQAGLLSTEELLPTLPPYVQPALIPRGGSSRSSNENQHDDSVKSFDLSLHRQDLSITQATQSPPSTADCTYTLVEKQQPDLVGSYSKAEYARRQATNREHQRRFRLRQKERTQAVEQQLATTQAELQELKERQLQLELLLKKTQNTQDEILQDKDGVTDGLAKGKKNLDGTPLLSVSLVDRQAVMTTEEVIQMSIQDFSTLWAGYIREIGYCLLQLPGQDGDVAQHRLHQLTFEAIRLVGRRIRLIPDDGHRALTVGAKNTLKPEFYVHLLMLLGLSEDQMKDMMLLRQLYLTRRHLLRMKRSELMAGGHGGTAQPTHDAPRSSDLAILFKENAFDDHHLLYNMTRAIYCGVLSMKQSGELEQAGLLDIAELHSSEVSSIPQPSAPLAQGDGRSHNNKVQPQLDGSVMSQALELQHASEVLGTRSSRAENERKQASNREHQRRFRLRQKAKTQAVEQQLASTTSELQNLKARQLQLELLLQNADIGNDHSALSAQNQNAAANGAARKKQNLDGTPLLSVSLTNRQAVMTTEEVIQLSIPDFSALWAEYIHEIGSCLLQLPGQEGNTVQNRLHQLTFEAIRLVGRRLRLNLTGHRALISTGVGSPSQAARAKLKPEFYAHLLGLLDLSDVQLEDLMLLRQLYVTRRYLLSVKRLELMAGAQEKTPHPVDSVTRMSELATHLQQNASEDHNLLYNMSRAFYCGVLSMKQAGEVMVHSHPKMPVLEDMLNTFAAERGYPAECDLVAAAQATSMEAEWAAFWQYTRLVNPDVAPKHDYVPFRPYAQPIPEDVFGPIEDATAASVVDAGSSTSPKAVSVLYRRGDTVWYRQRDGTDVPAKVVAVDMAVYPPSYGVMIGDNIRETEASRLRTRGSVTTPQPSGLFQPSLPNKQTPELKLEGTSSGASFGDFTDAADTFALPHGHQPTPISWQSAAVPEPQVSGRQQLSQASLTMPWSNAPTSDGAQFDQDVPKPARSQLTMSPQLGAVRYRHLSRMLLLQLTGQHLYAPLNMPIQAAITVLPKVETTRQGAGASQWAGVSEVVRQASPGPVSLEVFGLEETEDEPLELPLQAAITVLPTSDPVDQETASQAGSAGLWAAQTLLMQACASELTRGQHIWSQVLGNGAAEAFLQDPNEASRQSMARVLGDDQADTLQSMSTLLTAQEVQQQVQGNTQQALEWLAQSQPQHADSSSAPASMQHEGLCKLSLLPVDVMEMATVQLAPGRHCLAIMAALWANRVRLPLPSGV